MELLNDSLVLIPSVISLALIPASVLFLVYCIYCQCNKSESANNHPLSETHQCRISPIIVTRTSLGMLLLGFVLCTSAQFVEDGS